MNISVLERKRKTAIMNRKRALRKMTKLELIELLAEQEREILALKQTIEEMENKEEQRTLALEEFGNIAQAALALNNVFEVAQQAADQYVDSVKMVMKERAYCQENKEEKKTSSKNKKKNKR